MEVAVYNTDGKDTGKKVDLSENIFNLETPNDHAIYMDVRQLMANRRQGTHKSKTRGEVHGTNKKPYRQKGTGNARAGDRKSPLWRHGGRIFGPEPRDYSFKMNKKTKHIARLSALTYKAREESIRVLEDFKMEAPKTQELLGILEKLELGETKVLLVLSEQNDNVYLSGRNLQKTNIQVATDLNTYDILNADMLLLTEGAVNVINERLAN